MILAISTALPQGEPGEEKEVFDRGKQVLTILIGVLGTIVGFYFGSAPGGASPNPQPTAVAESTTTLAITSTTLPDGASNTAYSATLKASGGTPPLKWSVAPPLPAGLVLDPAAGIVSGKPTAALSKTTLAFTVTDSATPAASASLGIPLEIK